MVDEYTSLTERLTLKPVVLPNDETFLQELYFRSRDDLSGIFTDEEQLRQMLMIQYLGQKQTYAEEFPDAEHDIILLDGNPVGRFMVDRRPDQVFGIDLLLLPEWRTKGIGTVVLQRLFAESAQRGVPFRLSVVKGNPAKRLYDRLGCRIDGENATHFFMRWDDSSKAERPCDSYVD